MYVPSGIHSKLIYLVMRIPSKPICFHAVLLLRSDVFLLGCHWGTVALNRILLGRISERVYYPELHIDTHLYNRKPHETNRTQHKYNRNQDAHQCPFATPIWLPDSTIEPPQRPSLYKTTHLHPTEPTWHRQNPTHEHNRDQRASISAPLHPYDIT